MVVVEACPEDAGEIVKVINVSNYHAYKDIIPREHFKYPIVTHDRILKDMRECKFYIYRVDDKVVGVGALCIHDPGSGTGWVRYMYVLPEYQRRGIGSMILKKTIEEARVRGIKRLRLITVEKAYWALRLYTKHGFKIISRIPRPRWYDLIMEKTLL